MGRDNLFHPRWWIFVYKLNVGSSAITRPGYAYCWIAIVPQVHNFTMSAYCMLYDNHKNYSGEKLEP